MQDTQVSPLIGAIYSALDRVNDPEIRRPITELKMVSAVDVDARGLVRVEVLLTVAGCPMRDTLRREVSAAVAAVPGVTGVEVELGVMSDEQRTTLRDQLKGGQAEREIPFARQGRRRQVVGDGEPCRRPDPPRPNRRRA